MKFSSVLTLAAVAGTSLAAPAATFNGWVNNHCSIPLFVWTAADPSACPDKSRGCASALYKLEPGKGYQVPYHPVDGAGGGVTVKFQTAQTQENPYQGEYSLKNGQIWYNWYAVNGDPLLQLRRTMQIGDGSFCPKSVCEPGSTSCDWGKDSSGQDFNIFTCPAVDIVMNIC